MSAANQHVFSHGMRDTRATLEMWSQQGWQVLRAWAALSLAIALSLLAATWVVAGLLVPDLTPVHIAGLTYPAIGDIYVKRAMVKAASHIYLLADSTKIGRVSFSALGGVEIVHTLITDNGITDQDRTAFERRGVDVIVAQ